MAKRLKPLSDEEVTYLIGSLNGIARELCGMAVHVSRPSGRVMSGKLVKIASSIVKFAEELHDKHLATTGVTAETAEEEDRLQRLSERIYREAFTGAGNDVSSGRDDAEQTP